MLALIPPKLFLAIFAVLRYESIQPLVWLTLKYELVMLLNKAIKTSQGIKLMRFDNLTQLKHFPKLCVYLPLITP
jgi:hypothetical protein